MNSFNQIMSLPILLLHLFLFLLIIITVCPLSSHSCHEKERRALLNFKSSLDDPANRLASWQENVQHRNCCVWHGIRCSDDTHHVVSIDLRNSELDDYNSAVRDNDDVDTTPPSTALVGKLSPSLFSINHLEYLDLAFNDFHLQESEIPFRFSYLSKLTHLDLANTNFSASVSTYFANVSSLVYLDLSCTRYLYYSPCLESPSTEWIRGNVNLQVLRLRGVDLSPVTYSEETFSEHISYLSKLRDLDISRCNIYAQVFPVHKFHNLSHLFTLKMHDNYINSTIPLQLSNLTSLSILDLSVCQLQGSIPFMPQLIELDVSYNHNLHPEYLTRMFEHHWPVLQKLDISYTHVAVSIPSSISNAPLLVSLSAIDCAIQGSLPSSIYNLSWLQHLDLSHNNITSSIHSSISNLKDLYFLDISDNNLQGSIPKSICEMSSLQHLDLEDNNITGTMPSCITSLRNLRVFNIVKNSIGGKVSLISLINNLNLTTLCIGTNKLTVVIDQELKPSKFKLQRLQLQSCNMEGFIPNYICNFTQLKYLDLSFNKLSDTIPPCIYKLENLYFLDLSKNRLLGALPLLPPFIDHLDLSNNKINGEISIENVERLFGITLYNQNDYEFSDPILSSLCLNKPTTFGYINLSHNKLSGIIDSRNCTNLGNNHLKGNFQDELPYIFLTYLALNDNNFSGKFPMFILNFRVMKFLYLGNNNFQGIIPTGLGSLYGLVILSLRSNRFNGSIPEEIVYLKKLQMLDLSSNNFRGQIPTKLGNLTRFTSRFPLIFESDGYDVQYQLDIKGTTAQFKLDMVYSAGIDLSCNILNGKIPEEIGMLQGLIMLNLSYNHLSSSIPKSIGNMSSLESLDLSSNRLSGHIPQSLTSIDTLGFLNLSDNNLSGRIPKENHFDTLSVNGSAFAGNDLLCGFPLKKDCEGDHITDTDDSSSSSKVDELDQGDGKEKFLLYAIVAVGFAVGFWGLFFVLLINKQKWWFPYWRLVNSVAVKIVEGSIYKK